MESREDSSQNTRDAKVKNAFSNKAMVTTSGYICGRWRKKLAVLSSISESWGSRVGVSRTFITGITICKIAMRSRPSDHWRSRLLIRLDKVHMFAKYEAPFGAACGHHQWSREGKKLAVLSSISKSQRSRLGVSRPFITRMSRCEFKKFKFCLALGHN
jgi:hypothetical protein